MEVATGVGLILTYLAVNTKLWPVQLLLGELHASPQDQIQMSDQVTQAALPVNNVNTMLAYIGND